jgi:hypothetical protein
MPGEDRAISSDQTSECIGFSVSQPQYLPEMLIGLYANTHHLRDLLDYTSLAVEMGILDDQSAKEFFTAKLVIGGGTEFGIFPKSWLVPAVAKLERVGKEFVSLYGSRIKMYNQYQVRAVGFLSEMLGSFLLIRHLSEIFSNNIPANVFGYMTCVVEQGEPFALGLAD